MSSSHTALIDRLKRYAHRLGVPKQDVSDIAMEAYASALGKGVPEWYFAAACLKNAVFTRARNRRRQNLDYRWTMIDGESEPVEMQRLATQPIHDHSILLAETWHFIETLDVKTQSVIRLAALEWTADEIAEALSLEKKEVYWRLQLARKRMKVAGFLDKEKAGSRYIGVRRESRKFTAAIRKGGFYRFLGSFDTAEDAAVAYDKAAIEIHGPNAALNFPPQIKAAE